MEIKVQEPRPGYYRIERQHPVTGKRLILSGKTPERLIAQAHRIETLRLDVAAGILRPEDASKTIMDVLGGVLTVRQAWERYFAGVKTSSTRRTYHTAWKTRIEPYFANPKAESPFGNLSCQEITKGVLETWHAAEVKKGKAPKTIAHAWDALRGALKTAIEDGRLAREPWGSFTVKVKKRLTIEKELPRTMEEFQRLILAAAEHDAKLRGGPKGSRFGDLAHRVIVGGLCGLRQGEIGALGWDDVIVGRGNPQLRIRHNVRKNWHIENPTWDRPKHPTKTKTIDYLPLHKDVEKTLANHRRYLQEMGWYRPDGPVFPGKGGKWRTSPRTINPEKLRALFAAAVPEGDAKKFSPHALKHMFAGFTCVAAKGDAHLAMTQTRHASIQVFQMYLHTMGRGTQKALIPEMGLPYAELPKLLISAKSEWKELPDGRFCNEVTGEIAESPGETGIESEVEIENFPNIAEFTAEKIKEFGDAQKEKRRADQNAIKARYKASNATDFATAYRRWTALGQPGERPSEVTAAMNGAYQRTYRSVTFKKEYGRYTVQRDTRSWEAILRQILALTKNDALPLDKLRRLKECNQNADKPPRPGNIVTLQPELEAVRRAKRSRRAVLMAWKAWLAKPGHVEAALNEGETCCEKVPSPVEVFEGEEMEMAMPPLGTGGRRVYSEKGGRGGAR